jgi:hypothetical protein
MPGQPTQLLRTITTLLWACLTDGGYVNTRFDYVLETRESLASQLSSAGFTFCRGLLDVLHSASPPTVAWFDKLSSRAPKNVWGVYLLILKKAKKRTRLYVGSATGYYRGYRARRHEHKTRKMVPRYVRKSYTEGYRVTRSVLLAHCPIPKPEDAPKVRTLVVALEAMFSCIFDTMWKRKTPYGFEGVCPWPRTSFEWDGLCSHNALAEGVPKGAFDFTPEQLRAIDAAVKEKNRIYQIAYREEHQHEDGWKSTRKAINARHYPKTAAKLQVNKALQLFRCDACDTDCLDQYALDVHNRSKKHRKIQEHGNNGWDCCGTHFKYMSDWTAHKKTNKHINNHGTD